MKELLIDLENNERIIVPANCVQEFNKSKEEINLVLKDNGGIHYQFDWTGNTTTPLQRLNERKDITYITVVNDDDTKEKFEINWYWGDNEYCMPTENKYQKNYMEFYNELHINISNENLSFTLEEIMEMPEAEFIATCNCRRYKVCATSSDTIDKVNTILKNVNIDKVAEISKELILSKFVLAEGETIVGKSVS